MKKVIKMISILCTICMLTGLSASCGSTSSERTEHTHNYKSDWSFSETTHWHDCQNKGCNELMGELANHADTSDDGLCDTCGYVLDNLKGNLLAFKKNATGYSVSGTKLVPGEASFSENMEPFGNLILPKTYKHENITAIADNGFYFCTGLTSIPYSKNIKTIGNSAFVFCKGFTNISIPDNVQSIGKRAFALCANLTSVTIGSSVNSIGEEAFIDCSKLSNITVSLTNGTYHSKDGILYDNHQIICIPEAISGDIKISDKIGQIKTATFAHSEKITSVTIPGNVKNIGYRAFFQCYGLNSVVLQEGVTYIDSMAFEQCTNLKTISIPVSVTEMSSLVFSGCKSLTINYAGTSAQWKAVKKGIAAIPDYVKVICTGDTI